MPPKKGAKAGAAKKGAAKGRIKCNNDWFIGEAEENEYQEVPVTTEPAQVAQKDQVQQAVASIPQQEVA